MRSQGSRARWAAIEARAARADLTRVPRGGGALGALELEESEEASVLTPCIFHRVGMSLSRRWG